MSASQLLEQVPDEDLREELRAVMEVPRYVFHTAAPMAFPTKDRFIDPYYLPEDLDAYMRWSSSQHQTLEQVKLGVLSHLSPEIIAEYNLILGELEGGEDSLNSQDLFQQKVLNVCGNVLGGATLHIYVKTLTLKKSARDLWRRIINGFRILYPDSPMTIIHQWGIDLFPLLIPDNKIKAKLLKKIYETPLIKPSDIIGYAQELLLRKGGDINEVVKGRPKRRMTRLTRFLKQTNRQIMQLIGR